MRSGSSGISNFTGISNAFYKITQKIWCSIIAISYHPARWNAGQGSPPYSDSSYRSIHSAGLVFYNRQLLPWRFMIICGGIQRGRVGSAEIAGRNGIGVGVDIAGGSGTGSIRVVCTGTSCGSAIRMNMVAYMSVAALASVIMGSCSACRAAISRSIRALQKFILRICIYRPACGKGRTIKHCQCSIRDPSRTAV